MDNEQGSGSSTLATQPNRFVRWRRPLILAAVVVVVIAVGVFLLYRGPLSHNKKPGAVLTNEQANSLHDQQRLTAAQKAIDSAKKPQTTEQKNQLASKYMTLGGAYMDAKQYNDAIGAFQKAYDLVDASQKINVMSGLAYAYGYDGQKDKAIELFNKLIDEINTQKDVNNEQRLPEFQTQIKLLQKNGKLES